MNAIILGFHQQQMKFNGTLFDAIEYFIYINQQKTINLFLIKPSKHWKDVFSEILSNRYSKDFSSLLDRIIPIENFIDLLKYKFNKVLLLDWYSIQQNKHLLQADDYFIISNHTKEYQSKEYQIVKPNTHYFAEMPFVLPGRPYTKKILLNFYKDYDVVDNRILLTSPKNSSYSEVQHLLTKEYIIKEKMAHTVEVHKHFDELIYYNAGKYFDPHPRLIIESYFYSKHITYVNPLQIKDGSWYRWESLLKDGSVDRYVFKNDELISEFI